MLSTASHATFGDVVKVRLPDGAAWWKADGEFIGFLERFSSRQ